VVAAVAVTLSVSLPALAKVPPFELRVDTDGTVATVTVTLGDDVHGFDVRALDGLVAVHPASTLEDGTVVREGPGGRSLTLPRVGPGVYRGEIDLRRSGEWVVLSVPEAKGYPGPVAFSTRAPEAGTTPWPAVTAMGAAALVLGYAGLSGKGWMRRAMAAVGAASLLTAGAVVGGIAADGHAGCPVTMPPEPGFVPPDPDRATSATPSGAWYGTAELWTVLPIDGSYQPRKSVWWSEEFDGGRVEQTPDIAVTWERLDLDRPAITEDRGTNAHTPEDGWFMIAGIDPDEPGCWRVTATYRDAELSYVYFRS
jgi:hypothetical protein